MARDRWRSERLSRLFLTPRHPEVNPAFDFICGVVGRDFPRFLVLIREIPQKPHPFLGLTCQFLGTFDELATENQQLYVVE